MSFGKKPFFFSGANKTSRSAFDNEVNLMSSFAHGSVGGDSIKDLVTYMSAQKLRTIKGLEWLALQSGAKDKTMILSLMIHFKQLFA